MCDENFMASQLFLTALLAAATVRPCWSQPACRANTGFPSNDLPCCGPPGIPNPHPEAEAQGCALACYANPQCRAFTAISRGTGSCTAKGGCCLLKSRAAGLNATRVVGHCSAILRADPADVPPVAPVQPPQGVRSVLHIIVDDLRTDLSPYGQSFMATPHIASLAAGGTTFTRAYAAIAVCSPSRMSFLTGRLPSHTLDWNFIQHIRQANCDDLPDTQFNDDTYAFFDGVTPDWGGAGQCCSFCSADAACKAWTYKVADSTCHLKATALQPVRAVGAVAGVRGSLRSRAWTTLPGVFLRANSTVVGSGKVFHCDAGGLGPSPFDGMGMPPLQDPVSWTRGPMSTMGDVNAVAGAWPCPGGDCQVDASLDGVPAAGVPPLTDKIIGDDALGKLRQLTRGGGGGPWYLAAGFRKPHLPFRAPAGYAALYAPVNETVLATHQTWDASVPAIAYHQSSLWGDPYTAMPKAHAQTARRDYYAAVSWMDHQVGELLAELDAAGVANETLVVLQADHGYSLGEGSLWEKVRRRSLPSTHRGVRPRHYA